MVGRRTENPILYAFPGRLLAPTNKKRESLAFGHGPREAQLAKAVTLLVRFFERRR